MNMELVPEPFVEIPKELADKLQIKGGDKVKVSSARSTYYAKAMVTKRIKPLKLAGRRTNLSRRHSHSLGLSRACNDGRPENERTPGQPAFAHGD